MGDGSGSNANDTGTLEGAREHARSLAGIGDAARAVPVTIADLPVGAGAAAPLWAERLGAGGYASRRLPRGSILQIDDVEGDACVQLLVHSATQLAERLNVADTVKVQWQAYLATGSLLLSDMGRVLMTIVDDTSERHDCLCATSTRRSNEARYGDGGVGGRHPSGRDLLALGLAKFGGTRRDVAANINLFKSVRVDDTGGLHLDGEARPGTHVTLRAEMDVLVTVANTPHPLDERPTYTSSPVCCSAWLPREGTGEVDPHPGATPERQRAFENTHAHLLGVLR